MPFSTSRPGLCVSDCSVKVFLAIACCTKQELCTSRGIALPSKNFTLRYDTPLGLQNTEPEPDLAQGPVLGQ